MQCQTMRLPEPELPFHLQLAPEVMYQTVSDPSHNGPPRSLYAPQAPCERIHSLLSRQTEESLEVVCQPKTRRVGGRRI